MHQPSPSWICCQLGAREHYAVPRALSQAGQLRHLVTDAWIVPTSPLNLLPKSTLQSLRERFHLDLAQDSVWSSTGQLLQFELGQSLQKQTGWQRIIARNEWFQQQVLRQLERSPSLNETQAPTLFTYSYAALDLLNYAEKRGWRTVLGQIDPGLIEERIIAEVHHHNAELAPNWKPAPDSYWQTWQQECAIADCIMVNSEWSSQALQQVGIPAAKIKIVPLVYTPPPSAQTFTRCYPTKFSSSRPLRVLFLGQVILRKGIAALLAAAAILQQEPIEFWIVGNPGITLPPNSPTNLRWLGAAPRSETAQYYQQADLFLFPTLSDGFGLTQLEAQAWKLPLLASRFCGSVVEDQVNGLILPEVTGEAIAQALMSCLTAPAQLQHFADHAVNLDQFSLSKLQFSLSRLQSSFPPKTSFLSHS